MTAYDYWFKKFGEPPKYDLEKLAVSMMAEYGREQYNQALEDVKGLCKFSPLHGVNPAFAPLDELHFDLDLYIIEKKELEILTKK
jgi:hypothetical protein